MPLIKHDRRATSGTQQIVKAITNVQEAAAHVQPAERAQNTTGINVTTGETLNVTDSMTLSSAVLAPGPTLTVPATGATVLALNADVSAATVTNTALETSVYSYAVPGGTLGTTGKLRIELLATVLNNTGLTQSIQVRVKYGGTTIFNDNAPTIGAAATKRPLQVTCLLSATGATNTQAAHGVEHLGAAGGSTGVAGGAAGVRAAVHDAIAVDSTANQTLEITITPGAANANLTVVVLAVHVELVRV